MNFYPRLTVFNLCSKLHYYICPNPGEALPQCRKNNDELSKAWAEKLLMRRDERIGGAKMKRAEPEEKAD
jgi:hypothetical protein